jgi:azurin
MNAHVREMNAQRLNQLAGTTQVAVVRILIALALLPLLAACQLPGAAEQTVVKAVVRAKPISETATPAPTATAAPTLTPAPTASPASAVVAPAAPAPTEAPALEAQPVSLGTNGGEWQFDTTSIELAAGEATVLTFNNGAKTTPHNWLLISGDDYAAIEINKTGEQAGEGAAYIPDDQRIIARTAGLVKGGQSESVAFTAPAAGTYIYLCTFPGHFELGMKGVLTVK